MIQNLKHYKQVYFLGVGGIGMSALARYFNVYGMKTAGYDRTSTPLTDELKAEGIAIHFTDDVSEIPASFKEVSMKEETLIVLTPAVPVNHSEWNFFKQGGYTILKRSQVLGLITQDQKTLAVAGTHGKTTTSSILAHILKYSGANVTAFLGGITVNYESNFIQGNPAAKEHVIVVEADEFDRSFLTLNPEMAIITSMDPDHLDIYGNESEMRDTYQQFASQVKNVLVLHDGLSVNDTKARVIRYGIDSPTNYKAIKVEVVAGKFGFNLETPGYVMEGLTLGLPGRHNIENAVAAAAIALENGVSPMVLKEALENYRGVQRRFEVKVNTLELVYIDDYAHHPAELRAAILSARELFPGRRITGIFQPHLFSRTRDFADGFAESLDLLDQLFMLEIYPARELPLPGITAATILDRMKLTDRQLVTPEQIIAKFRAEKPDVVLTLGAGDIDRMTLPLTHLFTSA